MRPQNSDPISGFLTTDAPEDSDLLCRSFSIPNDTRWLGNFMGALMALQDERNWKPYGEMTPEECAEAYAEIIREALPGTLGFCPTNDAPTPYWDEDTDVDDQEPADEQEWYGYVPVPDDPPEELTFIENFAIWGLTGFIAFASWEVGFAPAVVFYTIAPKFVLAFKRGDVGEVIRIIIDANEAVTIDTSANIPGDVIRVPVIAGDDPASRKITIVQVT